MKPITTIKAGELVAFSTGEYSDHMICRLFKAKRDFANEDMMEALAKSGAIRVIFDKSINRMVERFDEDKLIAHLATLGCFEEIKARGIHLGDYGRLSISDLGYLGE